MASSSSSSQHNGESNGLSGIGPTGITRKVSESSRLFDVFINHRGPDVKQTLARELYNSLGQLKIEAFLDSEEKELGTSFPSTIETAISSAKVHIAIFSKRYAESPWCLAELVLMIESKAKIIPVFYEVEPWELRYIEKGVYAKAFEKYEEKGRYHEKLNEWKEALQTLSFTAGVEFHSFSDCKTIVEAVEKEVHRRRCLLVAKYPVGLDNLVKDFEKRCLDELVQDFEKECGLQKRENMSNVVAIFGMGGVGKTTLAKELFNRKHSGYSRASFLFEVREASMRSELPRLQSQLVKDLFDRDLSFRNIEEGKSCVEDSLQRSRHLNYLIFVDDIDHVEQLDALLIMDILNKSGNSLVIVTTRDIGVVISAGITVGYPLKGMDRNHGRQLFCWHAFGQSIPCTGYEALVDQFVDVCGGLPLSLQVLGRLVRGRPHTYWELNLVKARETLPRDVKQRLRISFDALNDEEKQVFMDIACFFLGKAKCMVQKILEGSGWDAQNTLETLKDKCLVVEEINTRMEIVLRMHDHLRDLGRELTLELSSPHRLWHPRDLKPLKLMGLKTILARTNSRCFHSIFDDSMGCQVTFFSVQSDSYVDTSASLLWLELEDIDIAEQPRIPSWILLQNLQYLKIHSGRYKNLWKQNGQILRYLQRVSASGDPIKLRELIISNCSKLDRLPSLSRLSFLQKIEIHHCKKLKNITVPATVISLLLHGCRALQRVVGSGDLIRVRELIIIECSKLEKLLSFSQLSCMEKIDIQYCDNLQSITVPPILTSLSIRCCRDFQRVVGSGDLITLTELIISKCSKLEEWPSPSGLTCMEKIEIDSCEKLQNITLPTTLDSLSLHKCSALQRVVVSGDLIRLTNLTIIECPMLEKFPILSGLSCMENIEIDSWKKLRNITLPTTLFSLSVGRCRYLQRVVGSGDLIKLKTLSITTCPELEELPSLSRLSSMEKIEIHSCDKLQNITLPATLISLSLQNCSDLQRVVGSGDLIKLKKLFITTCPELEELPSLSRLSCMENIEIRSCEKLQNITLPATLISLSLHYCSDLQRVSGSGDLINLIKLFITWCPELEEFPNFSRLSRIENIEIQSCRKLQNITLPATLISLSLHWCSGLQRVSGSGKVINLTNLFISLCPELEELPNFSRLSRMEKIKI